MLFLDSMNRLPLTKIYLFFCFESSLMNHYSLLMSVIARTGISNCYVVCGHIIAKNAYVNRVFASDNEKQFGILITGFFVIILPISLIVLFPNPDSSLLNSILFCPRH